MCVRTKDYGLIEWFEIDVFHPLIVCKKGVIFNWIVSDT